jgi:integrase
MENFRSPFGGIKLERRQSMRYQSSFDLEDLIQKGLVQLRDNDPEALKALLLGAMAGLRRKEIDTLPWSSFNWQRNTLRISVTEHFAVKSEDSIGEVDLDPELVVLFKGYHTRRTGDFVIESEAEPNPGATYAVYRCDAVFDRLTMWLRQNGVTGQRPLHALRKEFGSRVCTKHGLYAASRALRHADIATTAGHYLDKQKQTSVGLGHLLAPRNS